MTDETKNVVIGPEEGELVVCTVTEVKQNGAYVSLNGYDKTNGFIFIGEIASGWVKNIRGYVRDGQRVVCKVLRRGRKDLNTYELSLKSVSEERKRDTLQAWKNEQRATQLLKVIGEKVGWSDEEIQESDFELSLAFGTLYSAFEGAAQSPNALEEEGFSGAWISEFVETAIANIIPPFVEIRGIFSIEIGGPKGVEAIKEALIEAESHADLENEISVNCYYDGAPKYRIEIKAPDYKLAESAWDMATKSLISNVELNQGSAILERQ
jgi:translation initiation factor 2 subunit 1